MSFDCLADRPEPLNLGGRPYIKMHQVPPQFPLSDTCERGPPCPIAQRTGTILPQIITAAAAIFLHRLTGAEDLIFGPRPSPSRALAYRDAFPAWSPTSCRCAWPFVRA